MMTTDERMATIGRLNIERTDARKRVALLYQEFNKYSYRLSELSAHLAHPDDAARMMQAIPMIDRLIDGGLGRLKQLASEYQSLSQRLSEIGRDLTNLQAE